MGCNHGPTRDQDNFDLAQAVNLAAHLRREQRAQLVSSAEGFPQKCNDCGSPVQDLVQAIRTTCCDDCRPAIIAKSEIPARNREFIQTEPMAPEMAVVFKSDQPHHMTFNQLKSVNPWVLFFTALAAVALGKLFDLLLLGYIFWSTGNWPLTP